jgi:photosystem II stability/assembly factor-like uncharacterized protein
MKKLLILQASLMLLISCGNDFLNDDPTNAELGDICQYRTAILPPAGFEIDTIGEIDFNGSVQSFQFIDEKIGYALGSNNVGGYVEVFKTIDGGETWNDLAIGIDQNPRSMIFKDENFGIITVHDVTGCPPPNCQNKTVLLKTENGGLDWEEVEIPGLKGVLYDPKFDEQGNLYANLYLEEQSTIVKSIDNGATWDTLFAAPELNFELITFSYGLLDNQLYIPTKDGNVLVINTEGSLLKTLEIGDANIWDVELIDANNIVIALSGEVIKSTDGGESWETIYNQSARIIGFENSDKGLILSRKSACPTDYYQVNDLLVSTNNGGSNWMEAEKTATNLRINFANSQEMGESAWYTMIDNYLVHIYEIKFK